MHAMTNNIKHAYFKLHFRPVAIIRGFLFFDFSNLHFFILLLRTKFKVSNETKMWCCQPYLVSWFSKKTYEKLGQEDFQNRK